MKIFGLNVGSNASMPNGRGWVDLQNLSFSYLPIPEQSPLERPAPTYAQLGFAEVAQPGLPVHFDPEFNTHTYGHKSRFGDQRLWDLEPGDLLLFYATLDELPRRDAWGVYGIGHFKIDFIVDTRSMPAAAIKRLAAFRSNAHLKRVSPEVDLLIKGTPESRLYNRALPLSAPGAALKVHPRLRSRFSTVAGKPVLGGQGWWRWLLYSEDADLASCLQRRA